MVFPLSGGLSSARRLRQAVARVQRGPPAGPHARLVGSGQRWQKAHGAAVASPGLPEC